jgi:hypothetical protein
MLGEHLLHVLAQRCRAFGAAIPTQAVPPRPCRVDALSAYPLILQKENCG